jgi:uncharacterized protein YdaU (DUF1376 family)
MPRKPPAFQCYASNLLADKNFRKMSISEKGLFFTMYLESWANEKLPSNLQELSKYLGYDYELVKQNLSSYVTSFFEVQNGEYICPELEDYREKLVKQRIKQSDGGKEGAKRKKSKQLINATNEGQPIGTHEGSLIQTNIKQLNSTSSLKEVSLDNEVKDWVKEYDAT